MVIKGAKEKIQKIVFAYFSASSLIPALPR